MILLICYKYNQYKLQLQKRMNFQPLYQQILCSKDSMPLFYYYTPQQEKQSNSIHKNSQTNVCPKIDKEIQTENISSNLSICNIDETQDKDTKLKQQFHQLIEKQDISEIHVQSPANVHTFKPYGFFCLPAVSIYVRDCCFEVICAKFERIKSFSSSILTIPYQQGVPSYIKLLLENNKQKVTQMCLKQKFDNLQQGQLLYIRSENQNFQILAFYKLTRFLNSSFQKGLKKMLYKGKQIDSGKHKILTILYESRFDTSQKVTQMVMSYLQTIKNPFYQKITVLCNSFDDFIKISDLIRILILKFNSKNQLTL